MSLAPATKQTTDKPSANSVAVPVNSTEKAADVERKIRLYGVIAAMRRSRMPSNKQIAETLTYVVEHSPVDEKKLSPEGKKLVSDVREIISTAGKIVETKNRDEIFQKFVWLTRDAEVLRPGEKDPTTGEKVPAEGKNKDVEKAKRDAQEAANHLRTLVSLVLTNSEMRKLLTDATTVGRDILAKGAAKAATSVAPDAEKLRNADAPAPQDHFVDPDTPLTDKAPKTSANAALKRSASSSSSSSSSESEAELPNPKNPNVAADGVDESAPTTKQQKQAAKILAKAAKKEAKAAQKGEQAEGTPDEKQKRSLMARVKGLQSQHPDKVAKLKEGKAWLAEEYFPEERRDQWIWRGKKVIIECQKHADYQESVKWLLGAVEEWAVRGREAGAKAGEGVGPIKEDPTVRNALGMLRQLLERFANDAPLEPVLNAARQLAEDAQKDEGLRKWWSDVGTYIRKVLLEAGYIIEPACTSRAKELRESGKGYYNDKYKSHFDNLFDTAAAWFKSMGEDPLNKRFGEDWARLTRDLLFDSEGNLQFKKTLWEDVRKVILPALIDKVGYLPIPRVEYTDDSLDLVVENLTLSGRNLFPNIVEIEAHNHVRFSPYASSSTSDAAKHEVTFTFAQMQADMRDVAFYFRTKTGPVKMRDSGLADVLVGGQGVTATVTLTSSTAKDSTSVFRVKSVKVKVGSLKFSIRDSKHDLLYKTFKPLAMGLVKKQIQKALTDAIRTGFEYADGQLVGVRNRMAEAKASEDGGSRKEVLADLFKRKKDEASSVASNTKAGSVMTTSSSQFKVVSNKRNSILPDNGHPAGWVNRTAAKEELANLGEEWRSDAFDIVPKTSKSTTHPTTTAATKEGGFSAAPESKGPAVKSTPPATTTTAPTTNGTSATTQPTSSTPIAAAHATTPAPAIKV